MNHPKKYIAKKKLFIFPQAANNIHVIEDVHVKAS